MEADVEGLIGAGRHERSADRLNYRNDGSGWRPEGFTHIFVISDQGGTPRQLTTGDYQNGAPQWLPDSRTIVFSERPPTYSIAM